MTTIETTGQRVPARSEIRARPTGFVHDVTTIAGRALRAVPRDLEAVIPPVLIATFFFVVNIATLSSLTENTIPGFDYTAFQMPTAILLGVTGVSRAPALVVDVQNGYLDRLLMTPMRRIAILLGHLVADVAIAIALTVPILVLGLEGSSSRILRRISSRPPRRSSFGSKGSAPTSNSYRITPTENTSSRTSGADPVSSASNCSGDM